MAKRGSKKGSRRAKRSGGAKRGKALSIARGHRPVAFLEKMAAKMRRNLPRIERVIAQRKASGE